MSQYTKQTRDGEAASPSTVAAEAESALPPRRTVRSAATLQRQGGGSAATHALDVAAEGVSGSGGSLPHLQRIQSAFGRHDVSRVQAHVGGRARDAADALGAEAYATGSSVAFKASPDLHTAAHEAAHVVQQRHGVQLAGGLGQPGDRYEQHADAVADAVVAGRSAEGLLDLHAGGRDRPSVQRLSAIQLMGEGEAATGQVPQDPETRRRLLAELDPEEMAEAREELGDEELEQAAEGKAGAAGRGKATQGRLLGGVQFTGDHLLGHALTGNRAVQAKGGSTTTKAPSSKTSGKTDGSGAVLLTPEEAQNAIASNSTTISSTNGISAVATATGAASASWDTALVEAVAKFRQDNGLSATGLIDEQAVRLMVTTLAAAGQQVAATWLVIDFYDMPTANIASLTYDASISANASTDFSRNITMGAQPFTAGFESLVHTTRHEIEHCDLLAAGVTSVPLHEFRGEAIEILSVGMPEEGVAGFMDDAGRCLNNWGRMSNTEQVAEWARFQQVRRKVRERFDASTSVEQTTHQNLMTRYDNVSAPTP